MNFVHFGTPYVLCLFVFAVRAFLHYKHVCVFHQMQQTLPHVQPPPHPSTITTHNHLHIHPPCTTSHNHLHHIQPPPPPHSASNTRTTTCGSTNLCDLYYIMLIILYHHHHHTVQVTIGRPHIAIE